MTRFKMLLLKSNIIFGFAVVLLFGSMPEKAAGSTAPADGSIGGCYMKPSWCQHLQEPGRSDCVSDVKKNIKRLDGDRKLILKNFAARAGSRSADANTIDALLFFKFNSSTSDELILGGSYFSKMFGKSAKKERYNARLPKLVDWGDAMDVDLYTPEKNINVTTSTDDGKVSPNEITNWRNWNGQCPNNEFNYYFLRPIEGKKGRIYTVCVDPTRCTMKLDWLKTFQQYDVYQLTSPNKKSPDFLIVIDQTKGVGAPITALHILRSSKNGWEFQYSEDNRECESYC